MDQEESPMELTCPACKNKNLESFLIGQDELFKCPGCHGLWFDGKELRDVEDLPETELMSDFQDQLDSATISPGGEAEDRLCPRCSKPMNKRQYDVSSGIWIYGCPEDEGVWLDKGEVVKIHQHLIGAAQQYSPEKSQALAQQLKNIDEDENRKDESAALSIFGSHPGSKIPVPAWHLMDGVGRLVVHAAVKSGILDN
jgi:Zn-finger nucleic acid-binding protein